MKKLIILVLSTMVFFTKAYSQQPVNHSGTVTINPSNYGPKLILDDANTANKVPIEFRSNNVIKWEFGMRHISEQNDLALWKYDGSSYSPVMWFNQINGNIGIGTKTSATKLTIEGSHVSQKGLLNLASSSGDVSAVTFYQGGSYSGAIFGGVDNDMYFGTAGNDDLKFYTNTSNNIRMIILSSGNVGIGTSNPDPNYKLSVNGSIRSKEVKVEANWSDFVFKSDYELRTLEEVEQHINEKGHLPGIPSEIEVTKNGINLGEMDAKLLQKIEELTLYIIDMNKQVKRLESENIELKEKVQSLENE